MRKAVQFNALKEEANKMAGEKGWVTGQNHPGKCGMELICLGPNGIPQYYITDNTDAAMTSGTNELWADSSSGLYLIPAPAFSSGYGMEEGSGRHTRNSITEVDRGLC